MKRHVNKLFIEAHLFLWSILNDFRCMIEGSQLLMTNFSQLIMYVLTLKKKKKRPSLLWLIRENFVCLKRLGTNISSCCDHLE